MSYAADAVILGTSTGSTAYNRSAGERIIEQLIGGIVLAPLAPTAPHSVFNRSVVIEPSRPLDLTVLPSARRVAVATRGQVVRHVIRGGHGQCQLARWHGSSHQAWHLDLLRTSSAQAEGHRTHRARRFRQLTESSGPL